MKLYTAQAPNPMRVNVFMAEKAIAIPTERVAVLEGATRTAEFLEKNQLGEVPVLELDDGAHLTESMAICRYLEALYPKTPLMGAAPREAAQIEMWTRRMEQLVFGPISDFALHSMPFFAQKVEQVQAYAEAQLRLQPKRWAWLDAALSDGRTYIVNDQFSVADITGMAALMVCDFVKQPVSDELQHAKRWEHAVRARKGWVLE